MQARRQFGCIVAWVTYNEGWGLNGRPADQPTRAVDVARAADAAMMAASGRLIDACTGCDAHGAGDAVDVHHYPTPALPSGASARQFEANGEFGGVGLAISGHEWVHGGCHGYGALVANGSVLTATFERFAESVIELIPAGLSVSVYTQTADCERECNGVLTYDRILKPDTVRWRAASERILAAAAAHHAAEYSNDRARTRVERSNDIARTRVERSDDQMRTETGVSLASQTVVGSLRGLTPTGHVAINLESGRVQYAARASTVTAPACALSAGALYSLSLNNNHTRVMLANATSSHPMPFAVESVAAFAAGLDWHMASSADGSLLVTGPDDLGFVHLLNVTSGGSHWSDLLQYGLGTRLAHPVSSYDSHRAELWMQVVYDVSLAAPALGSSRPLVGAATAAFVSSIAPHAGKYRAYLTRHDVLTKTLMDVVPDPYALAALVFDPASAQTYGIGWCAPATLTRCLYRVANLHNASTPPVLKAVATLPPAYKLIMAGAAKVSNGVLYVVMAADKTAHSEGPPASPLHCVADAGPADATVCNRRGDGSQATSGAEWQVVGIRLASGAMLARAPRLDWDGASPEVLLCGA